MKRFLLFSLSAIVVAAMSAAPMKLQNARVNHSPLRKSTESLSSLREKGVINIKKAAVKAETGTPISEPPAGKLIDNMYVTSSAYGLGWGGYYYQDLDGGLGGVVEGDDGFVYVKGPISQAYVWGLGTPWIKCEKAENGTIVMHTPQLYAIDDGDPYYIARMIFDSEKSTFVTDPINTDIKFTWKDNVLKLADDECLVGFVDAAGEWFYMGDYDITYTVNEDVPGAVPAGLAKVPMKVNVKSDAADLSATETVMLNSYRDASNIYIGNLDTANPDAVFKGTLNGNKYEFASAQYLGVNTTYNSHVYVLACDAKVEAASEDDVYFNLIKKDVFTVVKNDEDGNLLSADYPESFVVNCGKKAVYYIDAYIAPIMEAFEDKPMIPADPIFSIENVSHNTSSGFDRLNITIPTVDVNGKDLNKSDLYYNLYLDGKVYTFTPDKYIAFPSEMTDIPYAFYDSYYDVHLNTTTGIHTIYFYDTDWKTLGVQSIYRGGGAENRSNIVTVINDISGVESVSVAGEAVESVETFDLTGRKMEAGDKGFAIKRIKYGDGTEKSVKVLVK